MDKMPMACYTSCVEVRLDRIQKNLEKIRAYTGLDVIPVVKGNAYGLGTVEIADFLVKFCRIKRIACARIFEALQILNAGIPDIQIMLLSPLPEFAIPLAVEKGIEIPLFRIADAESLSREAKKRQLPSVKVQLKIETGMNRIGVKPGWELQDLLLRIKKLENIEIDGVFTHFATADAAEQGAGNSFTREQFVRFKEALEEIRAEGIQPEVIHCMNTGAAVWMKEGKDICTHVRCGSLYFGYSSVQGDWNPIGVEESASWKTMIVNIRQIQPGESSGYGRAFMPDVPAKVAVVAVGYADGYQRKFAASGGAPCLIRGKRVYFVGICMDMGFVDVTGLDCEIGDEVTLFGEDGHGNCITGLEIGHLMGETRLAMFTHITERCARRYLLKSRESGDWKYRI